MIPSPAEGACFSFAACLALTPVVRAACAHHGILDFPGPLKIHTRPVPRLGGIAVALSIVTAIIVSARDDLRGCAFFSSALGVVWIAGLADDIRSISPCARLAAQIASGVLLWLGGWRFLIGNSLPHTGPLSLALICGFVALYTNAFNFLDGSDGLASGVAATIAAAWLALSYGSAHDALAPLVAACLAGSCCAFLIYNFAPATAFLGDSGSTILGFCVAFLALGQPKAAHGAPSLTAATLLVSAIPIADFALAVLRRLRSRTSPLRGDRLHLYDRMLARGFSARAVAVCFYAITAALGITAWLTLQLGLLGRLVVWTLSLAGVLIVAAWLGALGGERRQTTGHRPAKFAARKQTELPS